MSRGSPNPQTITHGRQVNQFNTGYDILFDTTLRRNLAAGDLTVQGGTHNISDFFTGGVLWSPTIVYGYHFTGDISIDVNWVTFRGCWFEGLVTTRSGAGVYAFGVTFDYCTLISTTVQAWAVGWSGWSANRCHFAGSSDGIRAKGGGITDQIITDCYIQTTMANNADHNDGMQNDGGDGTVKLIRCNIETDPVGGILPGSGTNGPDAAFIASEFTALSNFHGEVTDCLLSGGLYALRFYDGGLTTNITYTATGNRFKRGLTGAIDRGDVNITPTGQITWSGNVWDDDDSVIALT